MEQNNPDNYNDAENAENQNNNLNKNLVITYNGKKVNPLKCLLTLAIIPFIISFLASDFHSNYTDFKEKLKKFLEMPDTFESSMNELNEKLSSIENSISNLNTENISKQSISINIQDYAENGIIMETDGEFVCTLLTPPWNSNQIITANDGDAYPVEELENQKILLPYRNGDTESYFYGQFNENNHWDGKCVINIFKDDFLVSILEAVYNDGDMITYKQVSSSGEPGNEVWNISDRKVKSDCNSGETWSYFYVVYPKDFEFEKVSEKDIVYTDEFQEYVDQFSSLEGYYYGDTSNGYYNDNSKAYMIKYNEYEVIRTFYVGKFKDGYPNDTDAWEIVLDESNNINKYFYYVGIFENGIRKNKVNKDNYITLEQRDKILETNGIDETILNCKMNWYDKVDNTINNI